MVKVLDDLFLSHGGHEIHLVAWDVGGMELAGSGWLSHFGSVMGKRDFRPVRSQLLGFGLC